MPRTLISLPIWRPFVKRVAWGYDSVTTMESSSQYPDADPNSLQRGYCLRSLTPLQRRCGLAAWLGWLFDGLDGYLYVLVAAPFVAELLSKPQSDPLVGAYSSYIQAAFLVGWAFGGAIFGWVGDRFGRSRTIALTILTYAIFTGFSAFAWNWQSLLVFRFVSALGIGGEWAAGSSLVAETWPKSWRPWVSAALQSAYHCVIILATISLFFMAGVYARWVFLVGALPALMTYWIRRQIPEPDEWHRGQRLLTRRQSRESWLYFKAKFLKRQFLPLRCARWRLQPFGLTSSGLRSIYASCTGCNRDVEAASGGSMLPWQQPSQWQQQLSATSLQQQLRAGSGIARQPQSCFWAAWFHYTPRIVQMDRTTISQYYSTFRGLISLFRVCSVCSQCIFHPYSLLCCVQKAPVSAITPDAWLQQSALLCSGFTRL